MIALSCHFALDVLCYKGVHKICMILHRAPLPVEYIYFGMAPLPLLSIDKLMIMKGAVHSLCVFCVSSSAYATQLLLAIV